MKYTFILLLSILFCSCRDNTSSSSNTSNVDTSQIVLKDTSYLDIEGKQYKGLGAIPDSLRTAEQKRLIQALNELVFKGVTIKDNRMVLELTKEQFTAKNIPERYYYQLLKDIQNNNAFLEANGSDVKEMWEKNKKQYYEFMQDETP